MGDGYSVFWLTLMYLLGACIKKLNLVSHSKKKKYFILSRRIYSAFGLLETSAKAGTSEILNGQRGKSGLS